MRITNNMSERHRVLSVVDALVKCYKNYVSVLNVYIPCYLAKTYLKSCKKFVIANYSLKKHSDMRHTNFNLFDNTNNRSILKMKLFNK